MISILEEDEDAFQSPVDPFEDAVEVSPARRRQTAVSFAPPARDRFDSQNPFGEDSDEERSLHVVPLSSGMPFKSLSKRSAAF